MSWKVTDHGDRRHREFAIMADSGGRLGDGGKVASVFAGFGSHFDWNDARKHANLIGAAPDLQTAAKLALDDCGPLDASDEHSDVIISRDAYMSLRSALAKSEGEDENL